MRIVHDTQISLFAGTYNEALMVELSRKLYLFLLCYWAQHNCIDTINTIHVNICIVYLVHTIGTRQI